MLTYYRIELSISFCLVSHTVEGFPLGVYSGSTRMFNGRCPVLQQQCIVDQA